MILGILLTLFAGSSLGVGVYLLSVALDNRKKHQFFAKNAPGLPVLEDPSLFGGHNSQLVHKKYNWALAEEHFKRLDTKTFGFYYCSKPVVATIDLDFIKRFTVDDLQHTNRILLNLPMNEFEDDCIMFAEDKQWLRLRKSIAPAFTAHKIKMPDVQQDVNEIIGKAVRSLEKKLGPATNAFELDALDFARRYSLALVFKNFYKQDDVVDFDAPEDPWTSQMDRTLRNLIGYTAQVCAAFPVVKPLINWIIVNFHSEGSMRHKIMTYIREQTVENFKDAKRTEDGLRTASDGTFRRSMIDFVCDEYRLGKLTKQEYFNNSFFLFISANNTTADTVSRLLFNLAHYPEVQEKLRLSLFESGTDSEYLTWVVKETLRLHPSAPIGASRTLKCDIETLAGCLVPAGTFVVTPATAINRLKEYWGEDADEFRPERWVKAHEFHPCQFMSFGGGRRACPGRELALMEIKKLANELLRRYKFEESLLYPGDNSRLFDAPIFTFTFFDTPTYVRISHLEQSRPSAQHNVSSD